MPLPDKIHTWQMVQPRRKDKETGEVTEGSLEKTEIPMPELQSGQSLVEIAGCGVCHTDLGYFYEGVPTVNGPPLTLGHEISGTVIAGDLRGRYVIVPAVMPCNQCDICKRGRGNRCLGQRMPGNSLDGYGGFASHIVVPSEDLCVIEDAGGVPLSHFAVIADAVTTPYQAATRANLQKGDRAIVIGCGGGVGVYMTQLAKALGAQCVFGIDIEEPKLQRALQFGADEAINARDKSAKEVREAFRGICKSQSLPHNWGWTIFEVSGTRPGQEIALQLLSFVSKLIVVGFTTAKLEYSISRLMAFDSEMIGTWGCLPEHYPTVLEMVQSGSIQIEPFLETRPMSTIREAFEEAHSGQPMKRIVLEPDF